MMAGFELPVKAIRTQIASAVDLIVQANRLQGGPRKVTHVTEVVGMEGDTIVMQDIFKFIQDGVVGVQIFVCLGKIPCFETGAEIDFAA